MQADIAEKSAALAALCRRYGVARLEVFGSAARGTDFDSNRSDVDFLVTFTPTARNDLAAFADLKDALERLLGRPVDLVEREAVEASRNFIRRRAILKEAEAVYG
jgi:predicted nucleotidyltransferase